MKKLACFLAAATVASVVASAEDGFSDEALLREIDRLTALLEARVAVERPAAGDELVARSYDVSDLCSRVGDRSAIVPNLLPSKFSPPERPEAGEPVARMEIDFLIGLLLEHVEPATWASVAGASISGARERLFVRTIPRVHAGIAGVLAMLRESTGLQVAVEVRAVPVTPEQATVLETRPRELTDEEAAALLAAPHRAVFARGRDGRRLACRDGQDISYLHDFDVEIAQEATVGDPIPNRVFCGMTAEVRAILDRAADGAALSLQVDVADVDRPLRSQPTAHGAIELPTLELTRLRTGLWVPLDRTVVAGGATLGGQPCVILVRVRRLRT